MIPLPLFTLLKIERKQFGATQLMKAVAVMR